MDTTFTGKYRVRIGHLPRMGFKIGRADVAEYFVQACLRQHPDSEGSRSEQLAMLLHVRNNTSKIHFTGFADVLDHITAAIEDAMPA
jgi:hypothetical protein